MKEAPFSEGFINQFRNRVEEKFPCSIAGSGQLAALAVSLGAR